MELSFTVNGLVVTLAAILC